MGMEVEILADSACETAPHRLTTFRVRVPVFVHYEILRHRAFSFSVASTRAIPLRKQIQAVIDDPFIPIYWGAAKSGMQPGGDLPEGVQQDCLTWWLGACDEAVGYAKDLDSFGLHKQTAARLLMPFAWMDMVITTCAPGLMNFFRLRCDEKVQAETRRVAVRMALAYRDSTPRQLEPGEWHLPYVTAEELAVLCDARVPGGRSEASRLADVESLTRILLKYSVARCSRVSFLRHGADKPDPEKDRKSHDDRVAAGDWSVAEHQCRMPYPGEDIRGLEGNLPGVIQYRQLLSPNVHTDFDFATLDRFREDWT
jgi:Thymidylate synthase complementing protein